MTIEQDEAFRMLLRQLFGEYPVDEEANRSGGYTRTAALWRRDATKATMPSDMMLRYAIDTGVPNELIHGAYALIYG